MPRPKGYVPGPLTAIERAYITGNHKTTPIKKMARHINRGFNTVLKFMNDNKLTRYIPPKKRSLTDNQVRYIRDHHKTEAVWRIAIAVGCDYDKVQDYLARNELEEFYQRKPKKEETGKFFNYNQHVY
jgi:uncharacterized protein YeeX (DUF496 family)